MKLALIQPQFAPNLYDLSAMLKAGRVILLDTDTWSRKGRTHRAKIRNEEGTQWINIPVKTEDKGKAINRVRIDHSEAWKEPFWNGILHNYSTATYFDFLHDELLANFETASEFEKLIDFNLFFFRRILTYLELDISQELKSEVGETDVTQSIVYQEYQSKNYIRQFEKSEIALTNHPVYRQVHPGFEKGCSVLDLLLNYGPESFEVLEQVY